MDVALMIDRLVPAAEYEGSVTGNTQTEYDALNWTDVRTKPTWAAIQSEWTTYQSENQDSDLFIYSIAVEEAAHNHFHNINYKIEVSPNLHPVRSFTFGVLDKVEWYDDDQLSNKVLQVDIAYNHDVNTGMATDRTTTRTWYYNDGTAHSNTKVTTKIYSPVEQIKEMKTRRGNNVDNVNISLIGIVPSLSTADPQPTSGVMTENDVIASGQAFFSQYEVEKSVYVDTGSTALEDAVRSESAAQFDWFDCDATSLGITGVVDVRGYIIWNLSAGNRTS